MFLIGSIKFVSVKAFAVDLNDTFYYGEAYNSYTKIESNSRTVYTYPQGTILCVMTVFDIQYLMIACPSYNLVNDGNNKWGLYRNIAVFDNNGVLISFDKSNFFQMEGFQSDVFYTYKGVEYIIRTMEMTAFLDGIPYFFTWSNRTEGSKMILAGYIDGIENYMGGVNIENVSIDTSNLEQLVTDSNTIAEITGSAVTSIKDSLSSGVVGGSGLTDEDRSIFKDMRLYVILIFFCIGIGYFRNSIHQIGRNIRGI